MTASKDLNQLVKSDEYNIERPLRFYGSSPKDQENKI
jgi:hypothetical protein